MSNGEEDVNAETGDVTCELHKMECSSGRLSRTIGILF